MARKRRRTRTHSKAWAAQRRKRAGGIVLQCVRCGGFQVERPSKPLEGPCPVCAGVRYLVVEG